MDKVIKKIFDKYADDSADPINGLFISEENFYKAINELQFRRLRLIITNLRDLRTGVFENAQAVNKLIDETIMLAEKESNRLEKLVSLQETELIKQFMTIIKYIYRADNWIDMQTRTEIAFENMDDLLINKYKIESNLSLLSN
jgi:hypothetical protein